MIILDGGMGTFLQKAGMKSGEHPSVFGMQNPEVLAGIHKEYIAAGSKVILTNTFSANSDKLKECDISDVIMSCVAIARDVADEADDEIKVALDIGPIGQLMEPYGQLTFDDAYRIFAEIILAGEKAGADIIYFETFSDLAELRAGVLAAKELSSLPVWTTMSFEESGKTFLGTSPAAMAITLSGLGVDAMGANCSLGPKEMYSVIEEMTLWTDKPIIVKPNAGLPNPETGEYELSPEEFGEYMSEVIDLGATAVGGCCGTTPAFISELSKIARQKDGAPMPRRDIMRGLCSATQVVTMDGINTIGERINPTGKKRLQQALLEGDLNYVMSLAIDQEAAGADILDINVGMPEVDEVAMMTKVVKAVQSVTAVPLQIDSSNPEAIEAGLRACCGRAIINSTDASDEKLMQILPLAKKYGAAIVGLTMGAGSLPRTADERYEYAEIIIEKAREYGLSEEDVLIDCLALTVSAEQAQVKETLGAMRRIRDELGCSLLLGVSNISFGLPERNEVTRAFLAEAIACGLNFPIINPNNSVMMDTIASARALSGEDKNCEKYIARFASAAAKEQAAAHVANTHSIEEAVRKGLKKEVADGVREKLKEMTALDIVNELLIPALDVIGKEYEEGSLYLPQLINSANAASAGFEVIKDSIARSGGDSVERGKIVVATVQGDIHDIGKNIVKVVLENYGFKVIDLGKDVAPEVVAEASRADDVSLVGLSALMTTTLPAMAETIRQIRGAGLETKIMVGGAVLTEEYAEKIGADFYTKDATASVHVAEDIYD